MINKFSNYFLVIFIIVLWQVLHALNIFRSILLPPPVEIFEAGFIMFKKESFANDIFSSLFKVFRGFSFGLILGVLISLLSFYSKKMGKQISTLIEFLRPIPPIAWIPLAILWFGFGIGASTYIVFLGAFFPIFINTNSAIIDFNLEYVNTAKSFGASKLSILKEIIFPGILPKIFVGAKVGLGVAWMSVIAAELVGSQSGLGYVINISRLNTQIDKIIVGMLMIGILGLIMTKLIDFLKNRLIKWV